MSNLHGKVLDAAADIAAAQHEMRRAGGDVGAAHDAMLKACETIDGLDPRAAAAFAVALFNHLGYDDHDLAMDWAQYALLYQNGAVRRPFTPEEIAAAVVIAPATA